MYKKVFALLFLLSSFQLLIAQTSLLKNFPEGYTPDEIGRRIAYRFVTEKHALHAGKWIGYPETFYWNGSLKYAAAAKDKALIKLLQARFEHLFTTEKELLPIKNHVDLNMFGSLPLELYWVTKDCLMPIPNGKFPKMPNQVRRNGQRRAIHGRHVFGLTICT